MVYRGLRSGCDEYFVYFAFFADSTDSVSLKIGKSGSLHTRFRDLSYGTPQKLRAAFVISGGEFLEEADAVEYIFKRRLSPFNIHGEWFAVGAHLFPFLEFTFSLLNDSQPPDEEAWDCLTDSQYFSLIGHRPESGDAYDYDWNEVLRHTNQYELLEAIRDSDNVNLTLAGPFTVSDIERRFVPVRSSHDDVIDKYDINPNFDFREYFSEHECGKERKQWWEPRFSEIDI